MKILMSNPALYPQMSFTKEAINFTKQGEFLVGSYENLTPLPKNTQKAFHTRTNTMLYQSALQIAPLINRLKKCIAKSEFAVIIGTTTTGIEENFKALQKEGVKGFDYALASHSNAALFCKEFFDLEGLAFGISTACTSGAKALMQGARLLKSGLCEVCIVGGVDSLNTLSLKGFSSLEILSDKPSKAFSSQREGINIGEASAIFVLVSENLLKKFPELQSNFALEFASYVSNNDAFHITAPSKDLASKKALLKECFANLSEANIDYINAHGTGTKDNDEMESAFIAEFFPKVPTSSIKPFIGHTLGAAGAYEAGLCANVILQSIKAGKTALPPQIYELDESFSRDFRVVKEGEQVCVKNALSTSFAFGGDNALIYIRAYNGT